MLFEIKVPVLAESITEASVLAWEKQPGDYVAAGDKLVDLETDKVVLEIVTPEGGKLAEILKPEGSTVTSEELLARVDAAAQSPAEAIPVAPVEQAVPPKTSPSVRKLAAEQGLDPAQIPHSGDRVTKADVLAAQEQAHSGGAPAASDMPAPAAEPVAANAGTSGSRPEQRVPMTRLRRRVAERLLQAQHEHAILTTFNEIDMKPMMDLRQKYKAEFEKKHGVRLGFMSFFTKAAVAALKRFPVINASTEGDDIIYHGYYDIGIAVSSPRGLVVPIVRDADTLSFAEVEKTIAEFAAKAKESRLTIEDLTGGTFSITNGGIFGSMLSTPILNPPQSAILGMHNIVERPVAENGQVVIRPVMYVALSYDHRLVDGSDAVRFLYTIKEQIEDPARLLLEI